jgi:hypothetical protein
MSKYRWMEKLNYKISVFFRNSLDHSKPPFSVMNLGNIVLSVSTAGILNETSDILIC